MVGSLLAMIVAPYSCDEFSKLGVITQLYIYKKATKNNLNVTDVGNGGRGGDVFILEWD